MLIIVIIIIIIITIIIINLAKSVTSQKLIRYQIYACLSNVCNVNSLYVEVKIFRITDITMSKYSKPLISQNQTPENLL